MAASGNSMAITSTTGTTSTSGLSVRGALPMPHALRERLQQQVLTSRKVGLGNNTGQKDMEPPLPFPNARYYGKVRVQIR